MPTRSGSGRPKALSRTSALGRGAARRQLPIGRRGDGDLRCGRRLGKAATCIGGHTPGYEPEEPDPAPGPPCSQPKFGRIACAHGPRQAYLRSLERDLVDFVVEEMAGVVMEVFRPRGLSQNGSHTNLVAVFGASGFSWVPLGGLLRTFSI